MLNKRGAEGLPISTIIIVILAVLVLVIVAASFTGGMKSMFDKIKALFKIYSATDEEAARQICDSWCSAERYKTWCTDKITVRGTDMTCGGLGATCLSEKGELPDKCSEYT